MKGGTLKTLEEKSEFLIANWDVEFRDRSGHWNKGPCKFFYDEILNWHQTKPIQSLLSERAFLKDLYAGLAVWGLDRLGGGPKMKDFADFERTILEHREEITALSQYALPCDLFQIRQRIKDLFLGLDLMRTGKILVSNSKTLHFLIPPLFPIIDLEYITIFFKNTKNIGPDLDQVNFFLGVMVTYHNLLRMHPIADANPLKIIDNAIVNYVLKWGKKTKSK